MRRVRQTRRRNQGTRKNLNIKRLRPTMNTRMNEKDQTSRVYPILTKSTIRSLFLTGDHLVNLTRQICLQYSNLLRLTMGNKMVGLLTILVQVNAINKLLYPLQKRNHATTTTSELATRNTLTTNETNTRLAFLVERLPLMSNNINQNVSTTTRLFMAVTIVEHTTIKTSGSIILRYRQLTTTLAKTTVVFKRGVLPMY